MSSIQRLAGSVDTYPVVSAYNFEDWDKIERRWLRCFFAAAMVLVSQVASAQDARPRKPNIILIMADDLGYGFDHYCLWQIDEVGSRYKDPLISTRLRRL